MSVPVKIYRSVTFQEGQTPSNPNLSGDPNINPLNPDGGPAEDLVPYVGADKNVNLGEFGLTTGYVTFDTTPTGTPATQGTAYWDDSKSTVALIMNGTTQHIGQDQFIYVKNSTGSPIAKGVAVRQSGTDGGSGHILIEPMLANGTNASETFIGVTAEAIANGSFGQVMAFGELAGINTSTYTAGAFLYVSTTVAGQFQTTAPVAPNNIILVGRAINSKNNGDIFIRPHIGSNINNDEGVKITSPATGDLLQRQSNGLWENRTLSQVIGTAYVPSTRTLTINGTAFDLSVNRSWSVGTVTDVTAGTGIAVFPNPTSATPQVALTGQALSFHSLSGTGFVYRTSGIVGVRTLTAGTGVTITNGDGVSGNPTIGLNNNLIGGVTWRDSVLSSSYTWNCVCYGDGLFVAGGTSGRVAISQDGDRWYDANSSISIELRTITFGEGLFVAIGNIGSTTTSLITTSPDGVTWTTRTSAHTGNNFAFPRICYGNGRFVAVSDQNVQYSNDGITWTNGTLPAGFASFSSKSNIVYGNKTFVITRNAASNNVMYSTDGITWAFGNNLPNSNWLGLAYWRGRFYTKSVGSDFYSSSDGITWSIVSQPAGTSAYLLVTGNGVFLSLSATSSTVGRLSFDGTNFSDITCKGNDADACYGNGVFVSVRGSETVRAACSGNIINPDLYRLDN